MDVIRVYTYYFNDYGVTPFDFLTRRVQRLFQVKIAKDGFTVLHGRHEVIVDLMGVMLQRLDRSHTLHTLTSNR
jgi:hypothetical protein